MSLVIDTGAHLVFGPKDDQQDNVISGSNFVVVADGVSNSPDPRMAARLAVDTYTTIARSADGLELIDQLLDAPRVVADRLAALRERGLTTVAAAMVDSSDRVWVAHLGDSRVLIVRSGEVGQMTRPHNVEAETEDVYRQAPEDPASARRQVTRYLGAGRVDRSALSVWQLTAGDTVVATTDGVHDVVPVRRIIDLIAVTTSALDTARAIVAAAEQTGLTDNATCAVLRANAPRTDTDLDERGSS